MPPPEEAAAEDTFPKLLRRNARVRGARPAFRHKALGVWRSWSWRQTFDEVAALALALHALGLRRGQHIAIAGANRPYLYWTIAAAQVLAAVPVPVYADAAADELAHVLENAGVIMIAAQDQEQVDKAFAIANNLPALTHVLYDEPRGLSEEQDARLRSLEGLIAQGRALLAAPGGAAKVEAWIDAGRGADISVMLYTSGTTGRSKGVVLSAGGCVAAARDTAAFDRLGDGDSALAYLPLAWVGDHYMNYAQGFAAGFCMCCPESPETAAQDLREIGPSFYFAPPRVLEALLTRVTIRMEDASPAMRWLYRHFMAVARRWGEKILNRQPVPLLARLHYALGEIFIYGPLKNVLGFSNIRVAYTAGEAIGGDLFSFYRSLGLNLKQLYGQTEAFLYVTCHADGAIRPDTVGAAAPHVRLRIAPDGEVQFQSPGQFAGYHGDAGKTAQTLTPDGYVRTGDAGIISADGQLTIIDRAADVGKLRNGALFAPKFIENKLKFFPDIKEAVAFGDGREFVAVMLNIELASLGNWAERNGLSYGSYQELAAAPEIYDILQRHIVQVNLGLAETPMMAGAQIRRFLVLHKELDADDGELTRTQKVRRGFIAERYAPLVDALYGGAGEAAISTQVTFEDGRKGMLSAVLKIRDAPLEPAA